jgi:hypothetical protein
MKRIITLSVVAVAALAVCLSLWRRGDLDEKLDRARFTAYAERTSANPGWAPVQPWWEAPPDVKDEWRAKKAARLSILQGEAFASGSHIPREEIRAFLDAKVASGEIDYVIVFPQKGARWGEIIAIVDECRRSHVRIVLLNQYES